MSAIVIDGTVIAQKIKFQLSQDIKNLGFQPKLDVFLVGDDPASVVYVRKKQQCCEESGIRSQLYRFHSNITQTEVVDAIHNSTGNGILVQLPLPGHFDKNEVINSIDPDKDVDCFTPRNMGLLFQGSGRLKPCTPSGIIEIITHHKISTIGRHVVIINNSNLIGQPLSMMLSREPHNATVTVCHEHTVDLFDITRTADIVVTAVGRYPKFAISAHAVRDGAVVIDVATNRVNGKLHGDVWDFDRMAQKTSFITPPVGGVGPMTVAMLMKNTVIAAGIQK